MRETYKTDVAELERKYNELLERNICSIDDLVNWLKDRTKVNDEVRENCGRNYLAFNCHNDNEEIKKAYMYDEEVVMPIVKKYTAKLNEFFYSNEYRSKLDAKYDLLVKKCVNSIELFREENVELEVEENKLSTQYYDITGSMTVEWNGEEKTLQQMSVYLMDPDRSVREKAWKLIQKIRLQDADKLDEVMDGLVKLRHKKALNADCKDFREYMFKKMERFSYTPGDCERFHDSVLKSVVPLVTEIHKEHKEELKVEDYRPWDIEGVPEGKKPLRPYETIEELINKTLSIFEEKDEVFYNTLKKMNDNGTLDLDSRKAKSPGGFCDYFPVSKVSCIFMSGANNHDDVVTMTHEGGHSVHNTLTEDIPFSEYRDMPSETAELASMSMELICMDRWDKYYDNPEDLKRAKREHLEGIIKFLPWGILIDKFQHWIYLNPNHTAKERNDKFAELAKQFQFPFVDFSGLEEELRHFWKKQLHIFEVPFYYIEYAMAQLGALQIWRNYLSNPKSAIEGYKKALSLGSSVSIPEVYKAAGIKFDFSEDMIRELMDFTRGELEKLK